MTCAQRYTEGVPGTRGGADDAAGPAGAPARRRARRPDLAARVREFSQSVVAPALDGRRLTVIEHAALLELINALAALLGETPDFS
jgi:hypothetical protein